MQRTRIEQRQEVQEIGVPENSFLGFSETFFFFFFESKTDKGSFQSYLDLKGQNKLF